MPRSPAALRHGRHGPVARSFLPLVALATTAFVAASSPGAAHAEPGKQKLQTHPADALRGSEPAATIALRPTARTHRARIEVTPPELYCSVDGEPAIPARELSEVSTEAPHRVRCSTVADEGPFLERELRATAVESITARLSLSSSIATVRVSGSDGNPVEHANVTGEGPSGTSVGAFRPTSEPGLYASTVRIPTPTRDFALHINVNGVADATTNSVAVDTPVGLDRDSDHPAPRRFIPEVFAMGTLTVVGVDGGSASPGVAVGASIVIPEEPERRTGGELLFGVRAGFEKFGFDVPTTAGGYIPSSPSGTPLYGASERSVRMSEQAISIGVPLAYRMRTLGGVVRPYVVIVPAVYFEHAVGTSALGTWVNGNSLLPGFTGSLGAQVRVGPLAFFGEAGYRGVLPQKRAVGPVPLSGLTASIGAALPL